MTALGLGLGVPINASRLNVWKRFDFVLGLDTANFILGSQSIPNTGTGGSSLDAKLGSTTGVDTNDPTGSTSGGRNILTFTTDDYLEIPHSTLLNFSNSDSFTAVIVTRTYTPVSDGTYMGKYGGGAASGWAFYNTTSPGRRHYAWLHDGTTNIDGSTNMPASAGSSGDLCLRALRYDGTNKLVVTSYNNIHGTAQSTAAMTGTMANTRPLFIGRQDGTAYPNDMEFYAAGVKRGYMSNAELAQLISALGIS